jgi:hypothetical protein
MSRCCTPCLLPAPNPVLQPTGVFTTASVTQFTFVVDDKLLACILRDIAAAPNSVQILARFQLRLRNCKTLVKLVPGDVEQFCQDIVRVASVLQKYCVPYQEDHVLKVAAATSLPGTLSVIQNLLFCRLQIRASYLSRAGDSIILEVSDLDLATQILEHADDPLIAPICQPCCEIPCPPCKPKKCSHKHE